MNPTNPFAEAARRAFENLSLELQRSANDINFAEELRRRQRISTPARNYSTHVTFDGDDDIIELANHLTEVEFSDSDQEPMLQWQPEYGFPCDPLLCSVVPYCLVQFKAYFIFSDETRCSSSQILTEFKNAVFLLGMSILLIQLPCLAASFKAV